MMRTRFARCRSAFISRAGIFFALCFSSAMLFAPRAFSLPLINLQPTPKNVPTGTTVTFTVSAVQVGGAQPGLAFHWRRNGANIPGALQKFPGATNVTTSYAITNAQPNDAGVYSVVVFDVDGAVSSTNAPLTFNNIQSAPVGDLFQQRGDISDPLHFNPFEDSASADNFGASQETGEPNNAGIPGGASVWLKWIAPADGIVTFDTRGSGFDTTLGIYRLPPGSVDVSDAIPVVGDDDEGNFFNSQVSFNAVAGMEYEISMDGFYGHKGNLMLNWVLDSQTVDLLPEIVQEPVSLTVASNATATFFVVIKTNANDLPLQFQWFFNGNPIVNNGPVKSVLTIPNVQPQHLGEYRVAAEFEEATHPVFSRRVHLQINLEGNADALAQAKFRQAADPNSGPGGSVPYAVAVSGFSGTHLYNTYGAASEPGEPNHCGKAGGAPYWFSYAAAANGTLTVDANTPTYTNVVAVYTWPGFGDFATLVSVACASTNTGVGHEVAAFSATNGTIYYIVVDGLNGATGNCTLTYNLAAPPTITTQPQSQTVAQGSNVTLSVVATGTSPLSYQWRTNVNDFSGRISTTLTVTNFQATNEGNYDVVVTNTVGAMTSSPAMLYLNSPLRFTNSTVTGTNTFVATLLAKANTNYIIQATTNLSDTNSWISIRTNSSSVGIISILESNVSSYTNRFFRAMVKTN